MSTIVGIVADRFGLAARKELGEPRPGEHLPALHLAFGGFAKDKWY
jgi:hypothetical protein